MLFFEQHQLSAQALDLEPRVLNNGLVLGPQLLKRRMQCTLLT